MSASTPRFPWIRFFALGCARTVGRLFLWTLWFVLGALLVFQIRIAVSHEIELPSLALRRIESHLLRLGLKVHFGSVRFDTQGHVVFEGVVLSSSEGVGPQVQVDRVDLFVNPLLATAGIVEPSELNLTNARLVLPALLSPTGTDLPLVNNAQISLTRQEEGWSLDRFWAQFGALRIQASGLIPLPDFDDEETASATTGRHEQVLRFNRYARQLASLLPYTEAWVDPQLDIVLGQPQDGSPLAKLRFLASSVSSASQPSLSALIPQTLTASSVRLSTTWPSLSEWPKSLQVTAQSLAFGPDVNAGQITADLQIAEGAFALKAARLQIHRLRWREEQVPDLSLSLQASPNGWLASASTAIWRTPLDLSWRGDRSFKEGQLQVETTVTPAILAGLSPYLKRDLTSLLRPAAPAPLSLKADFSEGWILRHASGRLESGAVIVGGVPLLRADADFSLIGTRLTFDRILLLQGESLVRGSYSMDTQTNRYRFLLKGPFRPEGISPWFKDWWTTFWRRFTFGKVPEGDVSILGRWGYVNESEVFVGVDAASAKVGAAAFDRVRTQLFVRPHFIEALSLHAERGRSTARGTFTRQVDLNRTKDFLVRLGFDLTSDFPLPTYVDLFGADAVPLIAPYGVEAPPRLKAKGYLQGPAHPGGPSRFIDLRVDYQGKLAYLDFPLQDFSGDVAIRPSTVSITNLDTKFAQGKVTGTVLVDGPDEARTILFDARLEQANLGEAIQKLDEFGAQRTRQASPSAPPPPPGRFQSALAEGLVTIDLRAKGNYGDPYSFVGVGKAKVTGSRLGEINLLGQLSSALRQVPLLNFTTVSLNQAATDIKLEGDELIFPRLRITGPSAEIIMRGSYYLQTKQMAFDATVYPFAEQQNIFASTFDLVLSPLSAALELRLEGTPEKPKWHFSLGPTSLLRRLNPLSTPTTPPKQTRESSTSP